MVASLLFAAALSAVPVYRGMSYTSWSAYALSSSSSDRSLFNMHLLGTDTVALNFWWFQDTVSSNSMAEDFSRYSSTITSIRYAIDRIHALGMKVLLKPMLDVKDGTWRAYINPSDPDLWFANYTSFIATFADIAQEKNVEMLSIGCEFNYLESPTHTARWTNLISTIRSRYTGKLTYAANHSPLNGIGGYQAVPWWDQLDYIGIDAYFALTSRYNPTQAQLDAAWQNIANTIESWLLSSYPDKKVIFTEIGYRSLNGANRWPWDYSITGSVDLQEQVDCYEAVFNVLSSRSWWHGAFWWNWETNPNAGGTSDTGFTPQNKPVESVLALNYGGVVPSSWKPGDANFDGQVNDFDLNILLSHWGQTGPARMGEVDGLGTINQADLNLLLANWTGPASPPGSAPEPLSLSGLLACFLLVPPRRRSPLY